MDSRHWPLAARLAELDALCEAALRAVTAENLRLELGNKAVLESPGSKSKWHVALL